MKTRPLHIGEDENGNDMFLTPEERTTGVHVLGAPGSGKSQLANYMIEQDLKSLPGGGLIIDPHGGDRNSLYQQALIYATYYRPRRPMYFVNLSAPRFTYGFHAFAPRGGADISTRVQRAVRAVFTAWGEPDPYERPRALHWLTNTFSVGMERSNVGLAALRLLLDPEQAALRSYLTGDTSVASPWRNLNHKRLDQFEEQIESTRNRLDALVSAAGPRRFLSLIHPTAMIDFRELLARRAWVFVNLEASPYLDREHARVIGTLLIADFIELACQRPYPEKAPVSLYIDEAHLYISRDIAVAFEEARKREIYTTFIHQHLNQLKQEDERVFSAVLSTARTKIVFALGSDVDAKQMVHEVFVGENGVDYTEVKYRQPQTKFRPIAGRDRTYSRGYGGGTTRTKGSSRGKSTGTMQTKGTSDTRTNGYSHGKSTGTTNTHTTGVSTGRSHGLSSTHTNGRNTSRSVAEGTTETDTTSESCTRGVSLTEGYSMNHGRSGGSSTTATHSRTTVEAPDGTVTHTETESLTTSDGWNDGEGFSTAHTTSNSDTQGTSHSVGCSRIDTYADGESESDAEGWSETDTETDSESDSEAETDTESENWTDSDAHTASKSDATSSTKSTGTNWSDSDGRNWSRSVSDAPVTRYEEFREDSVEFYSLEEQRQRLADSLRVPPKRTCIVRRPDCTSVRNTVPFRRQLRIADRLVLGYEAAAAKQNGAVLPDEADALIAGHLRQVEDQAQKFAATNGGRVHFGNDVDDEPRFAARLKRRRTRKTPPEGQGGPQRSA